MKKFLPIIIIIALAVVILCFAACGDKTMDDTITSMSNEMTTIMDNLTSIPEASGTDVTNMTDMTDNITDNSGIGNDTTDITADENGKVTAE